MKSKQKASALICNVVEVPWQDYRISCYQPMAHVELHTHKVQEQVYHVLDGEGMMEMDGKRQVVRKHDVIYIPPGVEHAIYNNGLTDLTFIVATTPADDE